MDEGNRMGDLLQAVSINRRDGLKKIMLGGMALVVSAIIGLNQKASAQSATSPSAKDPSLNAQELFDRLPDWSAINSANPMTRESLVNLKEVSLTFLKHVEKGNTAELETELQRYIERHVKPGGIFDIDRASGLFLLFRIVFELPDLVAAPEWQHFGGWYDAEDEPAVKRRRESDDFHPSWPVYVARISNKLYVKTNSNPSSITDRPAYKAWEEYQYMRGKYKFRTSSYLGNLEFLFIADK